MWLVYAILRYSTLIRTTPLVSFSFLRRLLLGLITLGSSSSAEVWSIIETNISVVCACLITIAPALKRISETHVASSLKKNILGLGSSWSRRGQRNRYRSDTPKNCGRFLPSIHVNQPHLLSTADREMFEIATPSSNERATVDHSAV